MTVNKGAIRGFQGHPSSGIGLLEVEGDNGVESIPCDSAATLRALGNAYEGSCLGEVVYWWCDEYGSLLGLAPEGELTESDLEELIAS
jgi:hypothetical protein